MSIEVWLAFVVASSVLTIIPGPCVLLVVSQALTRGMSAALFRVKNLANTLIIPAAVF